jgi:hypothetical protein
LLSYSYLALLLLSCCLVSFFSCVAGGRGPRIHVRVSFVTVLCLLSCYCCCVVLLSHCLVDSFLFPCGWWPGTSDTRAGERGDIGDSRGYIADELGALFPHLFLFPAVAVAATSLSLPCCCCRCHCYCALLSLLRAAPFLAVSRSFSFFLNLEYLLHIQRNAVEHVLPFCLTAGLTSNSYINQLLYFFSSLFCSSVYTSMKLSLTV